MTVVAWLALRWMMSGGSSMSASIQRTHSPVAVSVPRLRWALRSGPAWMATSASSLLTSQVPSVEKLSITISSTLG